MEGKLIFIYGTMGAAKSANALMQYFELKQQDKSVALIKPAIDTRDGSDIIKSRIGLEEKALTFGREDNLKELGFINGLNVIIVDEVQFCTEEQINSLKELAIFHDINIYCYGLKTDFTAHLFEGSKRLLEIADEVRKLEMSCCECGRDAEVNARLVNGKVTVRGELIQLGSNESYKPLCYKCWIKHLTNNETL